VSGHIYMYAADTPELPVTYARKTLISLSDTPYYWWKLAPAFPPFPPSMAVTRYCAVCASRVAVGV
jgi:hypothetical protein